MAGGVIMPCLDFPRRRRIHLSRKASSDSPLSAAGRRFTRQPSSSSQPKNKPNGTNREEKRGRKTKKSSDDVKLVKPQSKWQARREISRRKTATRDLHLSSSSSSLTGEDERLGVEAKMAKKRLDNRLRPYLKSETNREISLERSQAIKWKETIFGRQRFNCIPMKLRTSEQENCSVCLEELKNGVDCLPCGHKFHSHCLRQWLQINPHCPYCRTNTNP